MSAQIFEHEAFLGADEVSDIKQTLRVRYQLLLDICNSVGTIENFNNLKPFFDEVAVTGKRYGIGFDPNPTLKWKTQKPADNNKYLVRVFNTAKQLEEFANTSWPTYYCKSIADTNANLTALFERNDD